MSKIKLTIDSKEIQATVGMTILEAALANDIDIPHLCYHPELKPPGACRLCMVEMADGLLGPSCLVTVKSGMVVQTRSEAVDKAIRPVVELLVAYHHDNCRGCPANGKYDTQGCSRRNIVLLHIVAERSIGHPQQFRGLHLNTIGPAERLFEETLLNAFNMSVQIETFIGEIA